MKCFSVYILLIFAFTSGYSQNAGYRIKLVNRQNPERIRYVNEGQRMKIFNTDSTAITGRIIIPTDSTLQIDSTVIAIDQLYRIKSNSAGLSMAKVASGVVFVIGVLMVVNSMILTYTIFRSDDVYQVILLPVVFIYGSGGTVATLLSGSALFLNGNNYDLRNKWDMSIVPVSKTSE